MGNQLLASKVVIEEEAPTLRSLPTLDTAVAGFIGVTEKGPVGEATLVTSMSEFNAIFGGWTSDSAEMVAAAQGYFENGGSQLYIVRVTTYASGVSEGERASATLDNAAAADTLTAEGKYVGTYAARYRIAIRPATSGVAEEFNLEVRDGATLVVETFPNLTMGTGPTSTASRYAPRIVNDSVNGSTRIRLVDEEVVGTATERRPANSAGTPLVPTALVGGDDALPDGSDSVSYIGTEADANGLYAFDVIDDITILACPGITLTAVQGAMIAYAEVNKGGQAFCILDPPAGASYTTMESHLTSLAQQTEYAAIYWPQVKIANPSRTVFGDSDTITVPPSGHIAGAMARTDGARVGGVWDPPAGTEAGRLLGIVGFETDTVLKEAIRDRLFPRRVNPLTTMRGYPRFIDGARTLKGDGNFPTVAQRRGVSFVERTIKLGIQFARHKNNNQVLRSTLRNTIYAFLKNQMDLGAFASNNPSTAFFVDFGDALNPPTRPNILTGRIGLATVQPAEYIVLRFSQDTRAVEALLG